MTGVRSLWVFAVCVMVLQSGSVHGKLHVVYMDTEDTCSYKVHLDDENQFKVERSGNSNADKNLTGYFPCFQAFMSGSKVVCINEQLVHFYRCSLRLKYYTFDASRTTVPVTTDYSAQRILDCHTDTMEWCSRSAANVKIVLETTLPDARIQDVTLLLDVARITSQVRVAFMLHNCGTTHYLQNSKMHMKIVDSINTTSCVKTFTYRDVQDSKKSEICVTFEEWPRDRSCSTYELIMYHGHPEQGDVIKSVKCSEPMPEDFCTDGEEVSFKAIRTGPVDKDKHGFYIKIWDNYDLSEKGGGLSVGTIVWICFGVFAAITIIVSVIICKCRGGGGRGGGGGGGGWSMPSLPSFDFDDDDD
ncbi:uncharacterized protein LOC124120237 [Haliotis rufescens]|uniref:uncharacterized protein LOC124120237 n=1 Tax=Haliotis rufescens TaxID=6454 RepID=UPI00201F5C9A|nr:uncharacterized protein LOC124120237 [Haliotis rufescens]